MQPCNCHFVPLSCHRKQEQFPFYIHKVFPNSHKSHRASVVMRVHLGRYETTMRRFSHDNPAFLG